MTFKEIKALENKRKVAKVIEILKELGLFLGAIISITLLLVLLRLIIN